MSNNIATTLALQQISNDFIWILVAVGITLAIGVIGLSISKNKKVERWSKKK